MGQCLAPDYIATTRYRDGIKRTIDRFDAAPRRQRIDETGNAKGDPQIAAYDRELKAAKAAFGIA